MKSKFNKLFITFYGCGCDLLRRFRRLAADSTDRAAYAATTETTETNTDNDHNSSPEHRPEWLLLWQPVWPVSAATWLSLPLPRCYRCQQRERKDLR
ncbi:MAG: hypothetical protein ACLTY5_06240 [Angelakisella sp.]